MGVNTDIQAALEAAAAGEETVESPETEVEVSEEIKADADKQVKGKGANERIRELVGSTKQLQTELEKTTSTLEAREAEVAKLTELLQFREKDAQVLAKINELYENNQELKPLLEVLDKAVRGEQVDLSQLGFTKKEEAAVKTQEGMDQLAKTRDLLNQTKNDLENQIAEQRHELILSRADQLAEKYLNELPKEYGEDDQRIVREAIVDRIDWDAIDENPEKLSEEFRKGFEKTIKWYGTPKGAAKISPSEKQNKQEITPDTLKSFINQDWAATKTVEDAKGKKEILEVSDDDFAKALANSMRAARGLRS